MAACSHDTVFAGLLPLVVEHLPRLLMRNPKGEEWGVAGHGTATDLHGGESDQERHYYFERAYHLENELEGSREEIEALRKVIGERDESIRGLQAHIEKLEKKIIEQHENLLLTRARAKADACAAAAKQARRTARLPQMQQHIDTMAEQISQMEMRREADSQSLQYVMSLLEEERATRTVSTAFAQESEAKAIKEAATVKQALIQCENELIAAHAASVREHSERNGRRLSLIVSRPSLGREQQLEMAHRWAESLPEMKSERSSDPCTV